mgnify:FL=1|jgi:hypothetical protein
MSDEKGWVYVLTNEFMPGLLKIGYSGRDPKIRAEELYKKISGVPGKFNVRYKALLENPKEIEKLVHKKLNVKRVNSRREFFKCRIIEAIQTIRHLGNPLHEEIFEKEDTILNGYQVFRTRNGNVIEGEFKDGALDGYGKIYSVDEKIKIFGEFKDGKQNGFGIEIIPKTHKYSGEFKDGKRHGKGTFETNSGTTFQGEFSQGKLIGYAIISFYNGGEYHGECEGFVKSGKGRLSLPKGVVFEGIWIKNRIIKGITFAEGSGCIYTGTFSYEKSNVPLPHGDGVVEWENGEKIEAKWEHGLIFYGNYIHPDGTNYIGEYKDKRRHGNGTMIYPDGQKYSGEWKKNKRHGNGILTKLDGTTLAGEWKDDELIKSKKLIN